MKNISGELLHLLQCCSSRKGCTIGEFYNYIYIYYNIYKYRDYFGV